MRKFLLWLSLGIVSIVVSSILLSQSNLGQGMRGMQGRMGMDHRADAQTIHQLFSNHTQIRRTVTEIPNGIRSVTESDNPAVTALIQSHVSQMYEKVNSKRSIPMIGMSSTLPTMLRSANQYQRQLHETAKGIEVIETSNDPNLVAVIREHAQEVTRFVEQGMPFMNNGMMK
jgi:hypothetical protein